MSKAGSNSFRNDSFYSHYKCIRPVHDDYYIDFKTYVSILRDVFGGLFDVIIKEGSVDLPCKIGTLFLRVIDTKPRITDGKVTYYAPVDWHSTKKLWEEDAEAKMNKQIIKFSPGKVYQVRYLSNFAYNRKTKYYTFKLIRSIQRGKLKDLARSKKNIGMTFIDINKEKKR